MPFSRRIFISIIVILVISTGCILPGVTINAGGDQDAQVQTAAAQTVVAALTEGASQQSASQDEGAPAQPDAQEASGDSSAPPADAPADAAVTTEAPPSPDTATPTITLTPSITPTQIPCNRGHFVSDVTIPDDTEINPGNTFTKTWRLKNTGSCTWTPDYDLVFHSGDRMSAPDAVALTSNVNPGGTVDLSVSLTAPSGPGTYRGNFKLRAADNTVFGINNDAQGSFYVRIVVPEPTGVPTNTPTPTLQPKPDLQITSFTLNPATPIQGQLVQVSITVMNKGNATTGPYTVEWWAGENFSSPACTWNVDNSNPGGGRVLECDYAGYASWYGSIVTKAVADPANAVNESNETNNVSKMTIAVNKP